MMIATMRPTMAVAALLIASGAPAQRLIGSFDQYGYQSHDSTGAQCGYNYVDASGGAPLTLTAPRGATASDDGGAVVSLVGPFQFYGHSLSAVVASSNGYVAAATDLAVEDGGDYSADCPLPAIADNEAAAQARVYVYHADLDGAPNGGNLYAEYFGTCPRPSESGVAEACTVVQWKNWALRGQTGVLGMQAVLYHTSFEIALQYAALDASQGSSATIGVQGEQAVSGVAYGCAGSHALQAAMAVCYFDPRYPPGSLGVVDRIFADAFETP